MTTTDGKGASKLYNTKRWQATRARILRRDLYTCVMCGCGLVAGRTHPRAAVVDHKTPYHGDEELFWCGDEGLQLLCATCHNRHKQGDEARGYSTQVGIDGFPVDKRHPFWTGPHWVSGTQNGAEPSVTKLKLVSDHETSSKPGAGQAKVFHGLKHKRKGRGWGNGAS